MAYAFSTGVRSPRACSGHVKVKRRLRCGLVTHVGANDVHKRTSCRVLLGYHTVAQVGVAAVVGIMAGWAWFEFTNKVARQRTGLNIVQRAGSRLARSGSCPCFLGSWGPGWHATVTCVT